jgi:hypothetical protein
MLEVPVLGPDQVDEAQHEGCDAQTSEHKDCTLIVGPGKDRTIRF